MTNSAGAIGESVDVARSTSRTAQGFSVWHGKECTPARYVGIMSLINTHYRLLPALINVSDKSSVNMI